MNTQFRAQPAGFGHLLAREEVADLLSRYPQVSDKEAKQIVSFLRKGRHLDIGIVTADKQLKPNLDRFMADHSTHFRLGVRETAAVVGGIAALMLVLWLIWEVIKPVAAA